MRRKGQVTRLCVALFFFTIECCKKIGEQGEDNPAEIKKGTALRQTSRTFFARLLA